MMKSTLFYVFLSTIWALPNVLCSDIYMNLHSPSPHQAVRSKILTGTAGFWTLIRLLVSHSDEPGLVWNPDDDVDIDPLRDPSTEEEDSDQYDDSDSRTQDDDEDIALHSVRGVSEDIAARMEM
jgi:hypothetical protein